VFPTLLYTSNDTIQGIYLLGIIVVPSIIVPLIYYVTTKAINNKGEKGFVDLDISKD